LTGLSDEAQTTFSAARPKEMRLQALEWKDKHFRRDAKKLRRACHSRTAHKQSWAQKSAADDEGTAGQICRLNKRVNPEDRPLFGLIGGGAKLPSLAKPGRKCTKVSAWRTALDTPSTTGTGNAPATVRASPASGAPASTRTSAPSSGTAGRVRIFV